MGATSTIHSNDRAGTRHVTGLRAPGVAAAAMLAGLLIAGCATSSTMAEPSAGAAAETVNAVPVQDAASWGMKIDSIRQTARGHMLDLRYEVTDPEKAGRILKSDVRPYLLHARSGLRLRVPNLAKVGPLQQTSNPPVTGVVYFMIFGNDGIARPGDEVTLVIGEAAIGGLKVE